MYIQVWKGGTADVKTVSGTFTDCKKKYHASTAIWVADRSMSDQDTLADISQMGLSYITGLAPSSQRTLLKSIHENCPEIFDEKLAEFSQDDQRYILCRHHQKGYRREKQLDRNLRRAYEELKKIKASPQNKDTKKLYHRAMRALEKYDQTLCGEISFDTYTDKKDRVHYQLNYRLNRNMFKTLKSIGHYYLLQTDLYGSDLTPHEAQKYYKSLIKVERCFRQVKSDLNIRSIRHWKARRIRGHIYLNYIGLWLVKFIEKAWRSRHITCEVPSKLRQWDDCMMLHELLDAPNGQLLEWQWNQGMLAMESFKEMQDFGEMDSHLPHM